MNIRKHWKKIVLSTAAFLWAGCSDSESVSQPQSDSSSSGSLESSSSSESSSTYKLARDTSVTCKAEHVFEQVYLMDSGSEPELAAGDLRDLLENNRTRTLEELEELEDKLENMVTCAPVYGVPPTTTVMTTRYLCDNDSRYLSGSYIVKDGLLYSEAELSSSSADASSSSAAPDPSPLCYKTDFTDVLELEEKSRAILKNKVDSLMSANNNLTDVQNECLKHLYPLDSGHDCITQEVAKKQVCDGEETVNPRYQAKLDSYQVSADQQIEECLDNGTQP